MKLKLILSFIFTVNILNAQVSDFKDIDFTKAENIAQLYKGHSLENLPILAHRLTNKLPTDVEKLRAIYSWVCDNITGDANVEDKIFRKRDKFKSDSIGYLDWHNDYKKKAFKKLLKQKKTVCTGYAYLVKELCFLSNIDCVIVDGYARSPSSNTEQLEMVNHSWNAVKLNGKWYLCDATWSSGYFLNNIFVKEYIDGYFLTDPELFAKNHFPENEQWLLTNTTNKEKFVSSPIVYGETFDHQLIPRKPNNLFVKVEKNEEIDFNFKTLKSIPKEDVSLIRILGNSQHVINIYDITSDAQEIRFKYRFKRRGLQDIHLKIKDDIVATYTIEVIKS